MARQRWDGPVIARESAIVMPVGRDARRRRRPCRRPPGKLGEHEIPGGVVADRGDRRRPEPEPRGGDRGDRSRPAHNQGDAVDRFSCWPKAGVTSPPMTKASGLQSSITRRSNARGSRGSGPAAVACCSPSPVGATVPSPPRSSGRRSRLYCSYLVAVRSGVEADELAEPAPIWQIRANAILADLGTVRYDDDGRLGHLRDDGVRVRFFHLVVRGEAGVVGLMLSDTYEGDVEVEVCQACALRIGLLQFIRTGCG